MSRFKGFNSCLVLGAFKLNYLGDILPTLTLSRQKQNHALVVGSAENYVVSTIGPKLEMLLFAADPLSWLLKILYRTLKVIMKKNVF